MPPGCPCPSILALLAVGPALVLVERPLAGTPLAEAGDAAPAGLAAAFAALRRLHAVGLALGALDPRQRRPRPDGTAGFLDMRAAQPAAGELQRDLDTVALLVGGATVVGPDAAVAATADRRRRPGADARSRRSCSRSPSPRPSGGRCAARSCWPTCAAR